MAWNGLNLTVNGRNALSHAQVFGEMSIKSIVIGDGNPPDNFNTQEGLVHQLYEIEELKIDVKEDGCELTADFPKVTNDYYFREIGVIVTSKGKDILYVITVGVMRSSLLIAMRKQQKKGLGFS